LPVPVLDFWEAYHDFRSSFPRPVYLPMPACKNNSVTFGRASYGPERNKPMILALVMVFQISVAMAVGFVLGRIWQIRCDLEQQRAVGFTVPPIARIPHP
jgi:hypothetical protein